MIRLLLLSFLLALRPGHVCAQTVTPVRHCGMPDHGLPVQPPLPPGARGEILEGDPKSDGIFTMRLQFPPDYVLAPHTHPADERVTVLSGEVFVGIGDSLDRASAQAFTSGCFYVNPAGLHHYVFSGKQGAVLQLTCKGPWGIHFLEQKKE